MKTRVVRYWHQADWLYQVEKWEQAEKDTELFSWRIGEHMQTIPAGTWRWWYVRSGLSEQAARKVAQRLSEQPSEPVDATDVVAEFGS